MTVTMLDYLLNSMAHPLHTRLCLPSFSAPPCIRKYVTPTSHCHLQQVLPCLCRAAGRAHPTDTCTPEEVCTLHILGQAEVGLKVFGELTPHKAERRVVAVEANLQGRRTQDIGGVRQARGRARMGARVVKLGFQLSS